MASDLVKNWFGNKFCELHPLLQGLHEYGGVLEGTVEVRYGSGLAGFVGRRLGRSLGVPNAGHHTLQVNISHDHRRLYWLRRFGDGNTFPSEFLPVGHFGRGYWRERTGELELRLQVDVLQGAWHWRCESMHWNGIPVPLWLAPQTKASKSVRKEQYYFTMNITMPLLGTLLAYEGALAYRELDL